MRLFRGWQAPESDTGPAPQSPELDGGPVIALVDEWGADEDALDWAAAEAAARGSELRLIQAFRWPRILDPLGYATVDLNAGAAAAEVVTAAVQHARRIMPDLRITTRIVVGRPITALLAEARTSDKALVVLGHGRRSGRLERALIRRLARRTTASLAVVGLMQPDTVGPSAGRVVVSVQDPGPQLGFAFRAARRRGTGLTVVHTSESTKRAVEDWKLAYPEVDVRWDFARGPIDSAVLAESAAAALTVLGAEASYDVLHLARGPVVMVTGAA